MIIDSINILACDSVLLTKISSQRHSNRVFFVKFNSKDQNMMASAGQDNTVLINDLRYGGTMHSSWLSDACRVSKIKII